MGTAELDDALPGFGLRAQLALELAERGSEVVAKREDDADVEGRWDHVVGRLSAVDVVVRVRGALRAQWLAGELAHAVRDDLVGVRVRRGARARLKDVHREMPVELAL